jgi:hypothetical protein
MPRLSLAIMAAVALSTIPASPPAVSAPMSAPVVIAPEIGAPLIEVNHRRRYCHRDVRWHYHPILHRRAGHRHVGPNCYPRRVKHHNRRHNGGCIRIGDVSICF